MRKSGDVAVDVGRGEMQHVPKTTTNHN